MRTLILLRPPAHLRHLQAKEQRAKEREELKQELKLEIKAEQVTLRTLRTLRILHSPHPPTLYTLRVHPTPSAPSMQSVPTPHPCPTCVLRRSKLRSGTAAEPRLLA